MLKKNIIKGATIKCMVIRSENKMCDHKKFKSDNKGCDNKGYNY